VSLSAGLISSSKKIERCGYVPNALAHPGFEFAAYDKDQYTLWMVLGAAPVPLTTSGSSPTSKTRTGRYLKFAFVKDHGFGRASTFVLVGYISD
jgi:hypothetical protein